MQYPGYLLNPGDMFQVDVERVLYATGASKQPGATPETPVEESEAPAAEEAAPEESTAEASLEEATPAATESEATPDPDVQDEAVAQKSDLKALRDRLKTFLAETRDDLSGKQKQALRSLAKEIKTAISRAGKKNANASQDVATLTSLFSELEVSTSKDSQSADAETSEYGLSKEEQSRFTELLAAEEENPYDPTKPYATPWRPRPYMSPFAFIPRYLEVNQKICSAVYLRHPVARQGEAEVPSPYGTQVNELAFNWYLRRH
jgi:ribosomal protein S4